jgi:protein SCO1/2
MSGKTPVPYGTIVLFLFWGLLLGALVLWLLPNKTVPPGLQGIFRTEPKALQAFELIDQHRQTFSLERLRDKWSFVFFGYTYCPDICPTTLATLTAVVKQLKSDPQGLANIQVVFVSVDPQRDTPELIDDYLKYFNETFQGLTGMPQEIDALVRQFGAAYAREPETRPGGYLVSHTSSIFLVDPHARLLAAFPPPHYPNTIVDQFRQIRSLF